MAPQAEFEDRMTRLDAALQRFSIHRYQFSSRWARGKTKFISQKRGFVILVFLRGLVIGANEVGSSANSTSTMR
ncbi:MAG: hypothetical protein GEU82_12760 [Luteitalea sp.]|nr:hypothetical protein [Luteitalea sp.]